MNKTESLFEQVGIIYDQNQKVELLKVDVNISQKKWNVYFAAKSIISSDYFEEIEHKIRLFFKGQVEKIDIYLTCINQSYENTDKGILLHYMNYFKKDNMKIDNVFNLISINADLDAINFVVSNKFEENLVDNSVDEFKKAFKRIGLDTFNYSIIKTEEKKGLELMEKKDFELEEQVKEKKITTLFKLWGDDLTNKKIIKISEIINPENVLKHVIIEGTIYDLEVRKLKNSSLLTIMICDDFGSTVICKTFTEYGGKAPTRSHLLKVENGQRVKLSGKKNFDKFINDEIIEINSISVVSEVPEDLQRSDTFKDKRFELHLHSKMSKNNGISSVDDYAKLAKQFGHSGFAITDHHGVQGFVEAEKVSKKYDLKIVYGVEAVIVEDSTIVFNQQDRNIESETYTVFDLETTGLSANNNHIIEIGAVKLKDNEIISRFQTFIQIDEKVSDFTTQLTGITNGDLKTGLTLKVALEKFKEYSEDTTLVAHNAIFDMQFLARNYEKVLNYNLDQPVLDTLELSKFLNPEKTYHSLKILSKHYGVALDSKSHHRADYDAEKLTDIFLKMKKEILEINVTTLSELNSANNINKKRGNHCLIYVKNQQGLSDLYKLISDGNVKNFYLESRILKSELIKLRENLIVVSTGCQHSAVIDAFLNKNHQGIIDTYNFYDYIEILPTEQLIELVNNGSFKNIDHIKELYALMIKYAKKTNKPVLINSNAHFTNPNLYTSKEVLLAKDFKPAKVKKNKDGIEEFIDIKRFTKLIEEKKIKIKDQYFKTTDEMYASFDFLSEVQKEEYIITNPNLLQTSIDKIQIIPTDLYTPEIEGVDDKLRDIVNKIACDKYGNNIPEIITKRLNKEMNSIIKYGFSVIYYISHKLVKYSLDNGYLVGSRGSVGSSLVATFMEITEINPLPPHYVCPNCYQADFIEDGSYGSGFDLPKKECPNCKNQMIRDGHDIPFETFLGFEGDKVPDIDLNFSGDFQNKAHEYVRSKDKLDDPELFDYTHAYRAGTIGTIAEKTAFAYTKNYFDLLQKSQRKSDIKYLAKGLEGIKRTTGQHPGGIIVIPSHRDIYQFTAVGYPADDQKQSWQTTHFDFHAIHDNLLKLDILGHDDPTMLKKLKDLTGIDPKDIDTSDPQILELFLSTKSLGVEPEQILNDVGTLGIPEFGTGFVMEMLKDTKPTKFSDLVQISGLSHGTDVWRGNAKELIDDGVCELKDLIGCRDDIMVYLMYQGIESLSAFNIMENVRKGRGLSDDDIKLMKVNKIPDWYIQSCQKIKYMFPKAHAAAYVLMALRIAYYKVYYPLEYYSAYFSSRVDEYDTDSMLRGSESLKSKVNLLEEFDQDMSEVKRKNMVNSLKMSIEMVERGYKFLKFDLYNSDAYHFIPSSDGKGLIMPFLIIDGLGEKEALEIIKQREIKEFQTKEDFKIRTKLKKKSFEKLELYNVFEDLEEDNQITLF